MIVRRLRGRILQLALLTLALVPGHAGERPNGDAWLRHVRQDLLPFWSSPDALGTPPGNFPTFRCNDGRVPDPKALCPEIEKPPAWIRPEIGRTYVRMQGRQTYAYAAAFHMTGERRWLDAARAGAAHTLALLHPDTGAPSWFEQGQPLPAANARTSQDQSYAVVGLAMLYYLTRDPKLERALVAHERFVMARYWDKEWGMLRWVPADGPVEEAKRQELVAQLDQLNAYMILVAPYLPATARTAWLADIRRLAEVIKEKFHDPESGVFWGTLEREDSRKPGARHNDFGHTIKAYWMLLLAAKELQDPKLEAFARDGATRMLARAWHPPSNSWASEWKAEGVNAGKAWWIFAELDQVAATLAQKDPAQARYLEGSWPFWLDKLTDHAHGEVWGWVSADGWVPPDSLKIHHWKSGFHSFEHALVSYLGARALEGRPAILHFATGAKRGPFRPYVMEGKVVSVKRRNGLEEVRFRMASAGR